MYNSLINPWAAWTEFVLIYGNLVPSCLVLGGRELDGMLLCSNYRKSTLKRLILLVLLIFGVYYDESRTEGAMES